MANLRIRIVYNLNAVAGGWISARQGRDVSRASISTNARLLHGAGIVERVTPTGDRRDDYTFSRHAWPGRLERSLPLFPAARQLRAIAGQGLSVVGPENEASGARHCEEREFRDFFEVEISGLIERRRERR